MLERKRTTTPAELGITPPLLQVINNSPRLFPAVVEALAGKPPHMDHNRARQCRDALIVGEMVIGLMSTLSGLDRQTLLSQAIVIEEIEPSLELVWQT